MSLRPVGEYEHEPLRGLPEALPEGERLLWQGSPCWRGLARRAFHTRKVALYFALLLAWRVAYLVSEGQTAREAIASSTGLAALAVVAVGLLVLLAWLSSRATVYTITDRRVVMRFGVAFVLAVNLPFRAVQSAALKPHRDDTGDIALVVSGADHLGFLMLWPHARPWRFGSRVQPMLRAVPEARSVADLLARVLAASLEPAPAEPETAAPLGDPTTPLVAAS